MIITGKHIAVALLILAVIALALLMIVYYHTDVDDYVAVAYKMEYGDNLWNISGQFKPEKMSTDEWVRIVKKMNKDITDWKNVQSGTIIFVADYNK